MAIDPDAQRVLDLVIASGRPPYEQLQPDEARALYAAARAFLSPEAPDVAEIREWRAPGPHGEIPVRAYRAMGTDFDARLPALVYFHGGGWVIGDRNTHDVVCRTLANEARCAVLSVGYRKAPEHKFPVPVDECFAAITWAIEHADKLRIDRSRVAVGGDSAGGNLSAVVSLLARDHKLPPLKLQLLLYPATDFTGTYASQDKFAEGYLLTRANQRWFREHYLRSADDASDWRASPMRAASHKDLPPAWVLIAGFDPLSDEGEAYAKRLEENGVKATVRRFPGQIHGFLTMGRMIRDTKTALDEAAAAVKQAFA